MEYLVPGSSALEALRRFKTLREPIGPLLQVSEIRTIASEDLWLSGSYYLDNVGIHFTWTNHNAVLGVLPSLDAALHELGARPFWGSLFTIAPSQTDKTCPECAPYTEMVRHRGPTGKFTNSVFESIIGII